jgi:hypothetical protein
MRPGTKVSRFFHFKLCQTETASTEITGRSHGPPSSTARYAVCSLSMSLPISNAAPVTCHRHRPGPDCRARHPRPPGSAPPRQRQCPRGIAAGYDSPCQRRSTRLYGVAPVRSDGPTLLRPEKGLAHAPTDALNQHRIHRGGGMLLTSSGE